MLDSTKRILYPMADGGVAVVSPAPLSDLRRVPVLSGMTQEHYEDFVIRNSVPEGVEYTIVDASELPADRTFRDAWEYDADG